MRAIRLGLIAGMIVCHQNASAASLADRFMRAFSAAADAAPPLRVAAQDKSPSLPIADRLAEAQAAKKAGNLARAISLLNEVVATTPESDTARLELAAALIAAERFDDARAQLEIIHKRRPEWVRAHLLRGALERQARNEVSALKAFDRVLVIEPQNVDAREGRLLAMSRLGSPDLALEEAKRYPKLDSGLVQRLHEDKAALSIRRSEQAYHEKPADVIEAGDRTIRALEANLRRYPNSERSRFDYVRALSNRYRYKEAIAAYETLQREKRAIPGYTHQAAGASYLALRKPEQAVTAFKAALVADRNDFAAGVGLFYALSDLTEFPAARTQVTTLAALPLDVEKQFDVEMLAAWATAYEDRLGDAHKEFIALRTRAPASVELQNALAKIYLWRGWPRLAEQEFATVVAREPNDLTANAGLVESAVGVGDYRVASQRLATVRAFTPDDQNVARLARAQAVRDLHELTLNVSTSRTKDAASRGQGVAFDARVFSTPLYSQHRIFAHEYYESSRFDSGTGYYKRLGIGIESVIPRVATIEVEAQQEFFGPNRWSGLLAGTIDLDDFWRARARYDSNSIDVPLRARVDGVRGDAINISGRYRWNEGAAVEIGARQLSMTDANTRRAVFLAAERAVVQGPFYKAAVLFDAASGRNSRNDVAYFSPTRDVSAQVTLKNEWLGWRRYERSFLQRVYVAGGSYTQHGFDAEPIGSVRYEHEWNLNDVTNIRYALGYVRRVYDGAPTTGPEAALGLNWKF